MKVIGLAGLKGSGKDTFADRLSFELQRLGVFCLRKAFADALKQTLKTTLFFSDAQLTNPNLKEVTDTRWGLSPRAAMRAIGEAYRERICPDYWVLRLDQDTRSVVVNAGLWRPACLLVTDVRNDVEADWAKRQGKLILVTRSQVLFDGHSTEEMGTRPASFFDFTVDNSGTLEDLSGHAEVLARQLLPWLQAKEE